MWTLLEEGRSKWVVRLSIRPMGGSGSVIVSQRWSFMKNVFS